jgi:hypothetical protein
VDFTDLPPAVAAASPGDTILLRWGTGAPYGFDLTIRRGIRIIGDDTMPISVRGICRPTTIPEGDLMVIHNIDLTDWSSWITSVVVEDCVGTVVVSGLQDRDDQAGGTAAVRSSRLVYTGCRLITPHWSIEIDDSGVWLIDCDIRAPGPSVYPFRPGAVSVARSDLWVIGGYVKGPDGVGNNCGVTQSPESGIAAYGSRAVLCGGARIEGGLCAATRFRSAALFQDGHSDPRLAGWHVRDPNVAFVERAEVSRNVPTVHREVAAVFPRAASPGQRQTIDVIGPSNGVVSVYASFAHGYAPIRLPVGDVWLDPALTLHIATGSVDSQRQYQATTTIPSWLPVGSTLVYQAVALTSSGGFELSTPGFAVVR